MKPLTLRDVVPIQNRVRSGAVRCVAGRGNDFLVVVSAQWAHARHASHGSERLQCDTTTELLWLYPFCYAVLHA